jgi:hypothetical protein
MVKTACYAVRTPRHAVTILDERFSFSRSLTRERIAPSARSNNMQTMVYLLSHKRELPDQSEEGAPLIPLGLVVELSKLR